MKYELEPDADLAGLVESFTELEKAISEWRCTGKAPYGLILLAQERVANWIVDNVKEGDQ